MLTQCQPSFKDKKLIEGERIIQRGETKPGSYELLPRINGVVAEWLCVGLQSPFTRVRFLPTPPIFAARRKRANDPSHPIGKDTANRRFYRGFAGSWWDITSLKMVSDCNIVFMRVWWNWQTRRF